MTKFLTLLLPLALLAGCSTHRHTTNPTNNIAVNMTQYVGQETLYQRSTRSYFVEPQLAPDSLQDGTLPEVDVVRYEPVRTPGCAPTTQAIQATGLSFQQNVHCR